MLGSWTFDDTHDLLDGGSYPSILQAAFKGAEGPEKTNDLTSIGIVPTTGPTEENGAISIPKDAYLWFTPNADGNNSANLSSAKRYELPFQIDESGKYIISFVNDGSGFNEFLLLECRIAADAAAGITLHSSSDTHCPAGIYSPSGIRRQSLQRGLNIVVSEDGTKRKILVP